jgi:hypothetical protein
MPRKNIIPKDLKPKKQSEDQEIYLIIQASRRLIHP